MDNRKMILETALDLFYARGYDAVGVQEVAERSGVTKPTLYYYFKSKYQGKAFIIFIYDSKRDVFYLFESVI